MTSKKVVLFDIDYTLFDTGTYKASDLTEFKLYEEVVPVLIEIAEHATVGVFSEGETEHQLKKLITTEIREHFRDEHLHIFTKKMEGLADVLLKYQGDTIFFVDDKLEVLKGIKESDEAIRTIWIKRGMYAEQIPVIEGFTPDLKVTTLQDILPYIKE